MKNKDKVTILDVALKANVNKSTVSRVLNGSPSVNPKTKERVITAIRELNYSPNSAAQSLASGKNKILGLVFSEQQMDEVVLNPFFSVLLKGICSAAKFEGYNVLLITSAGVDYQSYANVIRKHSADGFIILSPSPDDTLNRFLDREGVPYIYIGRYDQELDHSFIDFDNVEGTYIATKYLVELGHTDIRLIIGHVRGNLFIHNLERIAGFKKGLAEFGISFQESMVLRSPIDLESSYHFMTDYLNHERPSALIISNEVTTIASMNALFDLKVKIPEEISLIALGDSDFHRSMRPSLTTVSLDIKWLGTNAVKLLIKRITGEDRNPTSIIRKPELVMRESTKYPKNKSREMF